MTQRIRRIIVVGGGDSGLLTALAIRKLNPDLDIRVIDDFEEEIPQIGKSTYWRILNILHDQLGIDMSRFIKQVKPVWKCSVYFRDWCGYPEFHFPFDISTKFPSKNTPKAVEYYQYEYLSPNMEPPRYTKNEEIVVQRKSPWVYDPKSSRTQLYRPVAYHLNLNRFNNFLRDICKERGIRLINDRIAEVETDGSEIEAVSGNQTYNSDLYIDASGFRRILKREQQNNFTDFSFPLDTAFALKVDRSLQEVIPATIVETGNYGWFWQIDTYEHRDIGYVFSSSHVSNTQARTELVDYCGTNILNDDISYFEFTSGFYDIAWESNCVAIGNAGGFVEPLQSTGLTTNAIAAINLSNLIAAHGGINNQAIRNYYNTWSQHTWESIRDFIVTHYRYSSGQSKFWKMMQSLEASPRVNLLEREFKQGGFDTNVLPPTRLEKHITDPMIFHPVSFYLLMRNMGVESDFHESNDLRISREVRNERDNHYKKIRGDVQYYLTTEEFYKTFV
ncbi:tryptophan 7-halogenase [Natronorarus salvus]|uniref:tryptophan 7-halogenase n=1 Tax=Natronorarus salvus TaxID=3117733 RepID=UPI002F26818D